MTLLLSFTFQQNTPGRFFTHTTNILDLMQHLIFSGNNLLFASNPSSFTVDDSVSFLSSFKTLPSLIIILLILLENLFI